MFRTPIGMIYEEFGIVFQGLQILKHEKNFSQFAG